MKADEIETIAIVLFTKELKWFRKKLVRKQIDLSPELTFGIPSTVSVMDDVRSRAV